MIARLSLLAFFGAVAVGCSGPGDGGDSGTTAASGPSACVPGEQKECPCLGGGQGVQVCAADGAGYEPCQCEEGSGGETSGTTGEATSAEPTTTTTTSSTTTTTTDAGTTSTSEGGSSSDTTGAPVACPGGPVEIDLHQAMVFDNPPIADWPVTTSLTKVEFNGDGVHVEFSKLDGPDRWPDIIPPMWEGPLQYTLGMAECIDGQWYASAVIEYWYGLYASGGNVALDDQIAKNWYYDAGRWGQLAGRQPKTGEIVGIFVVAGNARAVHENDPLQSPVMERSNVVLVAMPDVNGAVYTF